MSRAVCGIQALRSTASGRRLAQTFYQYCTPSPPDDRIGGSIAAHLLAVQKGAAIVRVHDVAETVQALRVSGAIEGKPRAAMSDRIFVKGSHCMPITA